MTKNYRNLKVWDKAVTLADRVYDVTESYPKRELYSLADHLRRSAVSVLSNIAEGSARDGDKEFFQFLKIARGSLAELETQLIISKKRDYIPEKDFSELMALSEEISKMLNGLQKTVKQAA